MSSYPGDEQAAVELAERTRQALSTASRHSLDNPDWISPPWLVEVARTCMGSIDLDPMSDAEAQAIVQAHAYYTKAIDGLQQPWFGNVFINPAGGLVKDAWAKLLAEYLSMPKMAQAIWVGYSLEQLQTLQTEARQHTTPLTFPICIPSKRIAFVENRAMKAARIQRLLAKGDAPGASESARRTAVAIREGKEPPNSPSHANYISYIGPYGNRFRDHFRQFGEVR